MDYAQLAQLMFPPHGARCGLLSEQIRPPRSAGRRHRHPLCSQPHGLYPHGRTVRVLCLHTFAKQTGGVFYLRIEDTDTKRTVDNGIQRSSTT